MSQLTPSQKGAAAEAAITAAAIQLGLVVLRPLCEGGRYDLAIDLEPMLLRVQCKIARLLDGVLSVSFQTSRHTPAGYVRTTYSADEIDAICAYSIDLHRSFFIPAAEVAGRRGIYMRVDPTKNNQARKIKWASDYDFPTAIRRLQRSQLEARSI
ncbi:MAG TPA: group I intron-associated PD-(D/E)XK endonuclease [Solirubrobacteraceae bacterium]|jgi:hypothetical protein|nr:group I intron-associated PD-(D/E)XK endonuclease [Solirubrobacteraceae bacterium]